MGDGKILALYRWQLAGACFRCARVGLDTTLIKRVRTPLGDEVEFRACKECVLDLERERYRHAEKAGVEYIPGTLRQ